MAGLAQRRADVGGEEPPSPDHAARRDRLTRAALLALSVAAAMAVLLLSARAGPGVTPDSVTYMAAAESLAAGKGFRASDGEPYVAFPPLFPTVLTALSIGPIDDVEAARWLNAICFGATVFLAGWAVWRAAGSRVAGLVVATAVALLRPSLDAALHLWSEPLFTALSMLALALAMRRVGRPDDERILWAACAVAGLAALTRYIGVVVVIAVAATPLFDRPVRMRPLLRGLVAGAVALVPLALWCALNLARSGTVAGERYPSVDTFRDVAYEAAITLARPLTPPALTERTSAVLLMAVAGALAGAGLWRATTARYASFDRAIRRLVLFAFFAALYLAYLIAASKLTALDPIDDRLVAPVLPALVVVLVGGASAVVTGRVMRTALAILAALWLIAPLAVTARFVDRVDARGIGGYEAARWRDSALLASLRDLPDDAILYSNDPFAMRYWTGRETRISPRRYPYRSPATRVDDLPALREALASGRDVRLVWFTGVPRDFLLSVEALAPDLELEPLIGASDGTVYRITSNK